MQNVLLWTPGIWEVILIVAVVVLLFGGKKIPELMKGVGQGIKSFKEGLNDTEEKPSKKKDE